ncbi:MAG: VIT and VWA domain-containing protein [Gemmataceae bacterium]|nr:VIT and VWA domain-containing protein [Gemmataceae bacterium]
MRRFALLPALALVLAWTTSAGAHGLLIPADKDLPPLAMLNHKVGITIDDQVATTRIEQTFRNHTDRQLEATYMFPVPKGASVNKFTMWVDGKEVAGELLDAPKAKQIYTDIVRRTQDPGLLEYVGNNLFRLRVFPIPPKGDQKVTLSFTSVAPKDNGLVEYIYPLKTDGKATETLQEFGINATIKSQHAVQNVYSPTHAINVSRQGDKEVKITFEREQAKLDKDFQLFYSLGDKEVGLTTLTHRPISSEDGHFMLLLSPKVEMGKDHYIPRDVVLVLDTSGSMHGVKMEQAKKALKYCLDNLKPKDRFGIVQFATSVNTYRENLVDASQEQVENAKKWVDKMRATGGTAINDALLKAMALRSDDESRTFTTVFFTDGQPTIGESDVNKILKNVAAKNSANTRIFTFGVGEADGLNAAFLDQLAEQSRGVASYVRPAEDIETKVSSLYNKISHPVLANLKLSVVGDKVGLTEIYPGHLPDLFHGGQVVVLGRYNGSGAVAIKLTGNVGKETKEFVYEMNFAGKTNDDKAFVEEVWARRKVGFLLDQIRANGEKKELVDEVTALAKKYGIATPYTSYLVVPDGVVPVVNARPAPKDPGRHPAPAPQALAPGGGAGAKPMPVEDFIKKLEKGDQGYGANRNTFEDDKARGVADAEAGSGEGKSLKDAQDKRNAYIQAQQFLRQRNLDAVQKEKLGVELAVQMNNLKTQNRMEQTALRRVQNRNCVEIGGVWIDEGYESKMEVVAVKAMSEAYFRILERHPEVKEVFRLGNHIVWVTPSGKALVIDASAGKEKLNDQEIDRLFVKK